MATTTSSISKLLTPGLKQVLLDYYKLSMESYPAWEKLMATMKRPDPNGLDDWSWLPGGEEGDEG